MPTRRNRGFYCTSCFRCRTAG